MIWSRLVLTAFFLLAGGFGAVVGTIYSCFFILLNWGALVSSEQVRMGLAEATVRLMRARGARMPHRGYTIASAMLSWVPLVVGSVLTHQYFLALVSFVAMELTFRASELLYDDLTIAAGDARP